MSAWGDSWGAAWGDSWGEVASPPSLPTFTGFAGMLAEDLDYFDDTTESLGLDDGWIFD